MVIPTGKKVHCVQKFLAKSIQDQAVLIAIATVLKHTRVVGDMEATTLIQIILMEANTLIQIILIIFLKRKITMSLTIHLQHLQTQIMPP